MIIVGIMMCSSLKDIDWNDLETAFPCFFTVIGMPFFWSITDGLSFGCIAYIITKAAKRKLQEVRPVMYIISGIFVLMFALNALRDLGVL